MVEARDSLRLIIFLPFIFMGNSNSHPEPSLWPYLWALRDPEVLDWKAGLSPEAVSERSLKQRDLPVEVSPGIFLSDARNAHDIGKLRERSITHVLNCAGIPARGPRADYEEAGIQYCEIEAEDEEGYPMLSRHLKEARRFIQTCRIAGGRVVVHCMAGINRSGVIVCAEKMLSERMHVLDVVGEVRAARGNLCLVTYTFQEELVALARREGLLGPPPGQDGCRVRVKAAALGSVPLGDFAGGPAARPRNFLGLLS